MRRSLVISTFGLALALAPAVLCAQTPPPAQQPPAQPPAAAAPAQPPAAPAPKLAITTPGAMLLVQIKPDQTATFEELVKKLRAGIEKSSDATLKQQIAGIKIYKSAEPFNNNTLYVLAIDPVVPNAEYDLFALLSKTMTADELRAPETAEMWKRFGGAFAAGLSRLSLTPIAQ